MSIRAAAAAAALISVNARENQTIFISVSMLKHFRQQQAQKKSHETNLMNKLLPYSLQMKP